MEKTNESGRSLVEMVGVLAIMGLLSVTGIMGYAYAMRRYKANELLNEASKRATVVASQIMAGRSGPDLSIGEFTNNATGYGTFSLAANAYPEGAETFVLELSEVDPDVCEQMKVLTGGDSIMAIEGDCGTIDAPADHLTVRFHKDLRRGVSSEGEAEGTPSEYTDPSCQNKVCGEGEVCVSGACIGVTECSGNSCKTGCYSEADAGQDYICPVASVGCKENRDCNDWCATQKENDSTIYGCYCEIHSNDFHTHDSYTGVCTTVTKTEKTNGYSTPRNPSLEYTWWSAANFCKAIGRPMATKQSACNGNDSGCVMTPTDFYYWLRDCCNDGGVGFENCTPSCTDNSIFALVVYSGGVDIQNRAFHYHMGALCQ